MFQPYAQNKGTLTPGQTISVNSYTVQVERYLSQGGFAHVYLVRTPTPVYNTTHHVLKRIAVSNEVMLTEVKKEVDIMRLLKGHPNIVHFIDASWHKLPNGTFEVFILMEYCPGGGIIDMMNRRLRERLTEAEIMQIFVDVCEGVAFMHNSRPPLLHRDLKVENILQSSPTAFKLCDFGSASAISNPPSNMQEIRALEADLNKHTTLQYRAPEMVDVYSKRSINEKSDVWALGVLLYKLCYYTTPFEEHGPLAILNVQYRTPPYPVYSQDMNVLIASMLREHGAQRPSVFELLAHVHRLRGTKSKFSYTIPATPPLVPRVPHPTKLATLTNPLDVAQGPPPSKPALSIYNPANSTPASSTIPNQGIQARDKVLEAIAPMRRGRPHTRETSLHSSPHNARPEGAGNNWFDSDVGPEHNQAGQVAKDKPQLSKTPSKEDGWVVVSPPKDSKLEKTRPIGFGDDFAQKLWNTSDPKSLPVLKSQVTKIGETPIVPTPLAFTGSRMLRPKLDRIIPNKDQAKDAFEGLGLMTSLVQPAPTLGEARKLRTGLATIGNSQSNSLRLAADKPAAGSSPRPTPSPRPSYFSPTFISPMPTQSSSTSFGTVSLQPAPSINGLPIESRFPSLEELDASPNSFYPFVVNDNSKFSHSKPTDVNSSQFKSRNSYIGHSITGGHPAKPNIISNVTYNHESVRSEQVGVVAKEPKEVHKKENNERLLGDHLSASQSLLSSSSPQSVVRKHRSSVSMKPNALFSQAIDEKKNTLVGTDTGLAPPKIPARPRSSTPPRDWLTGDDHEVSSQRSAPIIRDSPSKRASFIVQSDLQIPESSTVQHVSAPDRNSNFPPTIDFSSTVSRFKSVFPDVEKLDVRKANSDISSGLTDNWSPVKKEMEPESSSGDEGPEDLGVLHSTPRATRKRSLALTTRERQNSVHDLVNQYGGRVVAKEKEHEPEELQTPRIGDYMPRKSQTTGLALPAKQESERKTPSPLAIPAISTKPSHRPQASIATQKPPAPNLVTKPLKSTRRSRPQSMFLFPSKSTDSPTTPTSLDTTSLMLPEEPRPRTPRRLSISDMVQKYEAISVRPVPSKGATSPANGQKLPGENSKANPPETSSAGEEVSRLRSSSIKGQAVTNERNIGITQSTLQWKPKNRIVSDTRKENTSGSRKLPVKAAPTIITSSNRTDALTAVRVAKSASQQESGNTPHVSRSPRKRTTSIPLNSPTEELRSPMDNEPYQGVGKLIDQWQKKSAEAEQPRPAPFGKRSFTPKRAGTTEST